MKNKSHLLEHKVLEDSKGNILIVDDDISLTSIMIGRYKSKKYSVSVAENGNDALVFMKYTKFDLIIIDYYMDTMYADEFIKKAKKIDNNIKIIVLLGQKGEEHEVNLMDIGADEILKKPFSPKKMDELIKKYIKE
ncbi:response regulator [Clostridium sp. C8-1-8]|uniref:response regulator n=1 Tax=Clostridium sp. C8-1-8 TaxID=2698831 RepID=UPI00136F12DB|nr:response regulator [Clostridium sp. C8-1-8]